MITRTVTKSADTLEQARAILTQSAGTGAPVAAACCSTEKQETCCEPSEKSACCGTTSSAGGCGCQ